MSITTIGSSLYRLRQLLGGVLGVFRGRKAGWRTYDVIPAASEGFRIYQPVSTLFSGVLPDFVEIELIILPMIAPSPQKILTPVVGQDCCVTLS